MNLAFPSPLLHSAPLFLLNPLLSLLDTHSDLTRSLDKSLNPSHPVWRIWIIVARFCCVAVYTDDMERLQSPSCELRGLRLWREKLTTWAAFQLWYRGLGMVEFAADRYAKWMKVKSWIFGLIRGGWREAQAREAGLL